MLHFHQGGIQVTIPVTLFRRFSMTKYNTLYRISRLVVEFGRVVPLDLFYSSKLTKRFDYHIRKGFHRRQISVQLHLNNDFSLVHQFVNITLIRQAKLLFSITYSIYASRCSSPTHSKPNFIQKKKEGIFFLIFLESQ